jgi:heme/copper-type cytochrome/quinol oxidase subunit 2
MNILIIYLGIGALLAARSAFRHQPKHKYSKKILVFAWAALTIIWLPALLWSFVVAIKKRRSNELEKKNK